MTKRPIIDYRAHTCAERLAFSAYASGLTKAEQTDFWKQTSNAAAQRVTLLRGEGYIVTGEREQGDASQDGAHRLILPKGTSEIINSKSIAHLVVWQQGGFLVEPLYLSIDHKKGIEHIDAVLELRAFLTTRGIPFWQADRKELIQTEHALGVEQANLRYLLGRLQ
jgi:hypothetical protein